MTFCKLWYYKVFFSKQALVFIPLQLFHPSINYFLGRCSGFNKPVISSISLAAGSSDINTHAQGHDMGIRNLSFQFSFSVSTENRTSCAQLPRPPTWTAGWQRSARAVWRQVTSYDDFHSGSSQKLEPRKDPERERPHHPHLHAKPRSIAPTEPKQQPRPQQTDT